MAIYPKDVTPALIYQQLFLQIKREKYKDFYCIYTDVSKSPQGVGAAAVSDGPSCVASLPREASIFSAKVYALQMAVEYIERMSSSNNSPAHKYVILSDSKSSIQSLHNRNDHPVIRYVVHKLHKLNSRKIHVEMCWSPSHVGIRGNERADTKAVEVSKRNPELIPIFFKDYYSTLTLMFDKKRNLLWQTHPNPPKLHLIKADLSPWPPLTLKREEQVMLNRLRIGHTNMTHNYLMDLNQHGAPPICPFCQQAILSVQHIFIQCPSLALSKQLHFRSTNTAHLGTILGTKVNITELISFLRANRIFKCIQH